MAEFDVQAHRGGLGLVVENTMAAFRNAVTLAAVTTLECDVQISADGSAMVSHDRVVNPKKIRDTHPATPGDSEFPYVGRFISRLSTEQLATLDCGSLTLPEHPGQRAVPGEPMATLDQVLVLAKETGLRVNVETKFDVIHPDEVAPRDRFVDAVVGLVDKFEMTDLVTVQSFDWQVLRMVGWAEPRITRSALISPRTEQLGLLGPSPWLAGIDLDDLGGDIVEAVARIGVEIISPDKSEVSAEMVTRAHERDLLVLPYTVDTVADMERMFGWGVDGFITNYPDRVPELTPPATA